jgi:hypothetical protein
MQETTQFVGFACSSIFIVAGMLAINAQYVAGLINETNMGIAEDMTKIRAHFDDQKKEREDLIKAEKLKKIQEEKAIKDKTRNESVKSMEDLLNDPSIKEIADNMLRIYGKSAQEGYLAKKLEEAGVSVDEPNT